MKRIVLLTLILFSLLFCSGCKQTKVEFQTVILPYYGYNDYCNLKTLHVASLERPRHVEFSFDDSELVILAQGQDAKYIIADFKYTSYAVLYVKYAYSTHKFTITKNKDNYYLNGVKCDSPQVVINKILKLKKY